MSSNPIPWKGPKKTTYEVESGPLTNEYVIYGTWIVPDFISTTFNSQSEKLDTKAETEIYFKFLNPLCRQSAPVSIIVFLEKCTHDYPMLMLTRIINFKDERLSKAKETNVVFNSTAKRSYMDFDVTWQNLTKEKGYISPDGKVAIEFELKHTITQIPIKPIPLADLMNRPQPDRLPRKIPIDDSRESVKQVSFEIRTSTNYIAPMLALLLFHIKKVRNIVYEIYTQFSQTKNTPTYLMQQLFYQLQTSPTAISFDGFNSGFKYSSLDPTGYNEGALRLIVNVLKKYWLSGDKFEETFGLTISTSFQYGDKVIHTQKNDKVSVTLPIVDWVSNSPITVTELLTRCHTTPKKYDNITLNDNTYDEVQAYERIESLPDILVLTVDRVIYDKLGSPVEQKFAVSPVESFKVRDLLSATQNPVFDCDVEYVNTGLISTSFNESHAFTHEAYCLCDTYEVGEDKKNKDTRGWLSFGNVSVSRIDYKSLDKCPNLSVFVYVRREILEDNVEVVDVPAHIRDPKILRDRPTEVVCITTEKMSENVRGDQLGFGRQGINISVEGTQKASFVAQLTTRDFDPAGIRLWKLDEGGFIERSLGMDEKLGEALQLRGAILVERPRDPGINFAESVAVFVKFFFGAQSNQGLAPIEFLFSTTKTPKEQIGSLTEEILAFIGAPSGVSLDFFREDAAATFEKLKESDEIGEAAGGDHIIVIAMFDGESPSITFVRSSHVVVPHNSLVPQMNLDEQIDVFKPDLTPMDPAWYLTSIYKVGCFVLEENSIAFHIPANMPYEEFGKYLDEMYGTVVKYWVSHDDQEHEFGYDFSQPVQEQITYKQYTRIFEDEGDE